MASNLPALRISCQNIVLSQYSSLLYLGDDFNARGGGNLTIATTHTMARYVLPRVIEKFIKQHPAVRLRLRQGNPEQVCEENKS